MRRHSTPAPTNGTLLRRLSTLLGPASSHLPSASTRISDGRGSAEQESRGPGAHGYSWELAAFLSHVGAEFDTVTRRAVVAPEPFLPSLLCSGVSAAGEGSGGDKEGKHNQTHRSSRD